MTNMVGGFLSFKYNSSVYFALLMLSSGLISSPVMSVRSFSLSLVSFCF